MRGEGEEPMRHASQTGLEVVEAVVLDLDGVLIDSEPVHLRAWKEALAEAGREAPFELGRTTLGWRTVDVASWLAAEVDLDADELLERRNQIVAESKDRYAPFPGWNEARGRLRSLGVPLAVASSGTRLHVERGIRELGLDADLVAQRCGEDVEHGKPDPEIYLAITEALGVAPGRAVAVEDSRNGILAARAAGVPVIAVYGTAGSAGEATFEARDLLHALDLIAAAIDREAEGNEGGQR
jgi:beta-phosphoglucomutase-like phosphatase (HAD superfamily)